MNIWPYLMQYNHFFLMPCHVECQWGSITWHQIGRKHLGIACTICESYIEISTLGADCTFTDTWKWYWYISASFAGWGYGLVPWRDHIGSGQNPACQIYKSVYHFEIQYFLSARGFTCFEMSFVFLLRGTYDFLNTYRVFLLGIYTDEYESYLYINFNQEEDLWNIDELLPFGSN